MWLSKSLFTEVKVKLSSYVALGYNFIAHVILLSDCSELFLFDSGAISVCPADRHPLLTTATRAFAHRGGEDPGQQAFSPHSGSCGSPGSKEWSNTLLVLRKTQVWKHYWRTEFFISKEFHWKISSLAVHSVLFGFMCPPECHLSR